MVVRLKRRNNKDYFFWQTQSTSQPNQIPSLPTLQHHLIIFVATHKLTTNIHIYSHYRLTGT